MNVANLQSLWEANVTSFLSQCTDKVTVHYKPVRTGTDVKFDSFFNESVNASDPDDIGVAETAVTPVEVTGKTHLDLYGTSISTSEDIEKINVGAFGQFDALFTCLLSGVDLGSGKTVFDEADYVVVEKDGQHYELSAPPKKRGLGNAFLVDVFLKRTNK